LETVGTSYRVNKFKMADKIVINSMDHSTDNGTSISYMEGYPLYPFFKKIYDEYLREMNAGADHLLESINADADNTVSKKIRD
jgi:cytoplasmic iron level regulating protein YaaA (DUF328/UPF0246 family)